MSNTKHTLIDDGKKEQESFIVALKYNDFSNKFFIEFSNEQGVIISAFETYYYA